METEGGDSNESSRLHIDLNEVPISLPGEEVAVPVAMVELPHAFSVCSGCGAPAVSPVGESIEQTQQDWKCFQCLLRNGGSEGGVGGDGRPIDINASPPREAETERERKSVDQTADVAVLVRRDPPRDRAGSSKVI